MRYARSRRTFGTMWRMVPRESDSSEMRSGGCPSRRSRRVAADGVGPLLCTVTNRESPRARRVSPGVTRSSNGEGRSKVVVGASRRWEAPKKVAGATSRNARTPTTGSEARRRARRARSKSSTSLNDTSSRSSARRCTARSMKGAGAWLRSPSASWRRFTSSSSTAGCRSPTARAICCSEGPGQRPISCPSGRATNAASVPKAVVRTAAARAVRAAVLSHKLASSTVARNQTPAMLPVATTAPKATSAHVMRRVARFSRARRRATRRAVWSLMLKHKRLRDEERQ